MDTNADDALASAVQSSVDQQDAPVSAAAPPPRVSEGSPVSQPTPPQQVREFDKRHAEPFTGLLYLGYLEDDVMLYGHRFSIRTPSQADRLQIGPVIKEYAETVTGDIAYQCALLAAYLTKVDGQPIAIAVFTSESEASLRDRFNWVINNLRRQIIAEVADKCMELEDQVAEVLNAMGKASTSPE